MSARCPVTRSTGTGGRPMRPGFGRDAKAALEKALRVAVGRRDRHIGDEHLLLALTVLPGPTSEVLADHGVTYAALNRVLYGRQETQTG